MVAKNPAESIGTVGIGIGLAARSRCMNTLRPASNQYPHAPSKLDAQVVLGRLVEINTVMAFR
jgi:hypothetical protein